MNKRHLYRTVLELVRDMATDLVSDGARVKVCVQQALGQGVFQVDSCAIWLGPLSDFVNVSQSILGCMNMLPVAAVAKVHFVILYFGWCTCELAGAVRARAGSLRCPYLFR